MTQFERDDLLTVTAAKENKIHRIPAIRIKPTKGKGRHNKVVWILRRTLKDEPGVYRELSDDELKKHMKTDVGSVENRPALVADHRMWERNKKKGKEPVLWFSNEESNRHLNPEHAKKVGLTPGEDGTWMAYPEKGHEGIKKILHKLRKHGYDIDYAHEKGVPNVNTIPGKEKKPETKEEEAPKPIIPAPISKEEEPVNQMVIEIGRAHV
jgi:hypothetical protein